MAPLPNTERLLAETAWLRALTSRLVGDTDAALDLQQEVALAALSRPHAPVGRSWLASVARNLAITLRRRRSAEARRLRAVAPREPLPSAAELVATAEQQQRAVAAVLALPAVYRDTVLMRFMQGLSLHAMALAMGVPEETVRTRQKRALALLRERLAPAGRERDRRGAFAVLLAPLWAVGVAVKSKSFVVAAAGLLLAALLCVALPWHAAPEPASPAARGVAAAVADVAPAPTRAPDEGSAPLERVEVAVAVAATASPTTAQLRVRVRWQDGTPAADVPVLCVLQWSERTLRSTDAAGEVRFVDLRPGDYSINPGDFTNKWATLAAGDDQEVELRLRESTQLRGMVVDGSGTPVPFAELLQSMPGTAPQWTFPRGRCDAAGRFLVRTSASLLGARDARGGVSDFLLLTRERDFVADPEPITLRLHHAAAAVRGRVLDEEGQPVRGAWVQLGRDVGALQPDDAGRLWQEPPAALLFTDASGRFEAAGMRAGQRDLLVHHHGLAAYRETLDLVDDVPREVEVVLRRGCVLRGAVADPSGRPVAGAEVEAEDLYFPQRGDATTAADGSFELVGLPAGELVFTVTAAGFARAQRTFAFAAGETRDWAVTLAPGLRILGRLVDDAGTPMGGWSLLRDGSDKRVLTGDDGRFVITDCDAVGNGLSVQRTFGFTPIVQRLENVLPSESEQAFVVPRSRWPHARLRGRCVDAAGAPIDGVGIDLEQDGRFVLVDNETLHAAADGTFDVGPLPAGQFAITPSHRECVFARVAVEVQPGDGVKELGDLVGSVPARLSVHLTGDLARVARSQVMLVLGDLRVAARGDGAERSFAVVPGRWRLAVAIDGAEVAGETIDLAAGAQAQREVALR